jgi:hypothetical protein
MCKRVLSVKTNNIAAPYSYLNSSSTSSAAVISANLYISFGSWGESGSLPGG